MVQTIVIRRSGIPGPSGATGATGATGPSAGVVTTFSAISGVAIAMGMTVETAGYAAAGDGGDARYVVDTLAQSIGPSHPLGCIQELTGLWARPIPGGNSSSLRPEQFGAKGDGETDGSGVVTGTNDRAAIQGVATYANAVGITQILFTRRQYNLWAVTRTDPADQKQSTNGETLYFTADMKLFSPGGTILKFLGRTGNSLEDDWYLIKSTAAAGAPDTVWRPCAILLLGDQYPTIPVPHTFRRFSMDGITLEGSCVRTAAEGVFPANTSTGDGWGLDKGIRIQDTVLDQISLRNGGINSFKGELFYVGGYGPDRIDMHNFDMHTTNGDIMNPGGIGKVYASDFEWSNGYQAIEALTGKGHFYSNGRIHNCYKATILGGRIDIGVSGNYAYPNRPTDDTAGWSVLRGCTFSRIENQIAIGSYVDADVTLIDSQIVIGDNTMGARDMRLKVSHITDLVDGMDAVTVNGPHSLTTAVPGAPAGTYIEPPSNILIEVWQSRTFLAESAGRNPGKAFGWNALGYIDPSVRAIVHETLDADNGAQADAANPISFPFVDVKRLTLNAWSGRDFGALWYGSNINADTTLQLRSPAVLIGSSAAAGSIIQLTMPLAPSGGASYGFADGQEVVIVTSTNGVNFVFNGAAGNVRLRANFRALRNNHDWIKFRWSAVNSKWEEVAYHCSTPEATPLAVAYAAAVTLDCRVTRSFEIAALTGNITLNNLSYCKPGDRIEVLLKQDATGGRTIAYGANWKFSGAKVLSAGANVVDRIVGIVRADGATIDAQMLLNFA